MSCKDCKDGIIYQTRSLISNPKCNEDCPEEIVCEDIIGSNCVFYSGLTLACPSGNPENIVYYGDTLTQAITKLYGLVCQNSTSNTVQVTANDRCYGYLASKITSSSLDISVTNPGACEKLNLEEKCWTWTNIGASSTSGTNRFRNNWGNYTVGNNQNAQISNIKGCSVKLRGRVVKDLNVGCNSSLIMVVAIPPLKDRVFSVNVLKTGASCPEVEPKLIIIDTSGNVSLVGGVLNGLYIVSFDGIEYETN